MFLFDAIYIKDRESRWVFANPALVKITGKSAEEVLGRTDAEIYSNPEIGKTILAHDKKIMESGKPETFEECVYLPDGPHFFISVKSPRFDDKGAVIGIVGISHDITNRKRREEELKQSQRKYLDLIESTGDFIWEMDSMGRYTFCSPQTEKLWGLKPADMIGKTPFDLMPPEDRKKALEYFKDMANHPRSFSGLQTTAIVEQGRKAFIETNGVPFFDAQGRLLGFRGISRDITKRKKAEEALQLSEDKFSKAFNNSPNAITITQLSDGRIIEGNESSYKMFGYSQEEVIGKTTLELGIWADPGDRFKLAKELSRRGIVENMELILRKKDGTRFPVTLSAALITISGQQCFLSSFIDITDRKKAEEDLRRAEWVARSRAAELEALQVKLQEKATEVEEYANHLEELAQERLVKLKEAERLAAIGATAGIVGHDIRNPLQAIVGDLYLAMNDVISLPPGETKDSLYESLDAIQRSVEYVNKIVQDLQDFAKPISPNPDEINLRDLCEDVLLRSRMPGTIRGSCEVSDDAKKVVADPELLRRIVNNLVSNAVQAMPKGGKLSINDHREKRILVIEVQDTGVGIPEDVKSRLFTPLFTTKSKGQGFGLAVVKRVTEAMNGTVSFESETGKGTKFIVRLPPPKAEKGKWVYNSGCTGFDRFCPRKRIKPLRRPELNPSLT